MTVITLPNAAPPDQLPDAVWSPQSTASAPIANPSAAIVGFTGEFSRGPENTLIWCRDIAALESNFGPETANPVVQAPLNGWVSARNLYACGLQNVGVNRVMGATGRTAYVALLDAGNAPILSILAATPGTWANGKLQIIPAAGTAASTFKVTVTNTGTSEPPVIIDNLPYGSAGAIAASIAAINAAGGLLVKARLPLGPAPSGPATFALVTTGTLPPGDYRVVTTYTDAGGRETQAGPETAAITVPAGNNGQINLTVAAKPAWAVQTNVYVTGADGGAGAEVFSGSTAGTTYAVSATPTSSRRPPKQSEALLTTGTSTAVPVFGTITLPTTLTPAGNTSNGDDGANVQASVALGAGGDTASGIYVFANATPKPAYVFMGGGANTDATAWQAQAQLAQANNWTAVVSFPKGTSSATALSTWASFKSSMGAYGAYIKAAWNWFQTTDTLFAGPQWFNPASLFAGISAAQPYNTAAYNKAVPLVTATEYNPDRAGVIVPMAAAGLNVLAKGIAAAPQSFGYWSDTMANGQDGFDVRTNQYLANLVASSVGWVPGTPNSPNTRSAVYTQVFTIFSEEARKGMIPDNGAANLAAVSANTTSGTASATTPTTNSGGQGSSGPLPSDVATAGDVTLGWLIICDDRNNKNPDGTDTDVLNVTIICRLFKNAKQVVILARVSPFVTTAELQAA
jgi:hypothetical protein